MIEIIQSLIYTFFWLILSYFVFILVLKYCILRRPQPKSKKIDLDLRIPLPIPESEEKLEKGEESERWCVIGAGFSGLSMASALMQKRIPFTVYEREEKLGGNWFNNMYEGVHMISSRKTTEISDFPMPEEYPIFPSSKQVLKYLENYAEHFKIIPNIVFNTEIISADPILDGRQWKITLKGGEVKFYKGVIICTGHDWDKNIPSYPGLPSLPSFHSRDYKSGEQLEGKRVLIIGGGNSACDIAVDAARYSTFAAISMRRGYWILPRTLYGKSIPEILFHWAPEWLQQFYLNIGIRIAFGKYSSFGLQDPSLTIYDHPITVSDNFLMEIKKGTIKPFKEVSRIDGKEVTFVDGQKEEFDLIVYGTGYKSSLPVIDHLTLRKEGIAQFLHGIIHPRYKNIFLLGLGQSRSGCGPLLCAAAGAIVKFIDVQNKLTYPLGVVLRACGSRAKKPSKNCRDVVINPHKSFAQAWIGGKLIYTVPFFEKRFFNVKNYDPMRYSKRENIIG